MVPLKQIEHGFGFIVISSPCTPDSIYLRGTIGFRVEGYVSPYLQALPTYA